MVQFNYKKNVKLLEENKTFFTFVGFVDSDYFKKTLSKEGSVMLKGVKELGHQFIKAYK